MQNFCFPIPKNSNVLLTFIDFTRHFKHIERNILPIDNFVAYFVYRDKLFLYIPNSLCDGGVSMRNTHQ